MRYLMAILVFLAINLSTHSQSYFSSKGFIEIEGNIIGYKPTVNNGFVAIRTYNIAGLSKDTAIAISPQGKFACKVYQPFEGDIALLYNDRFIELYSNHSEKIGITITENKWASEDFKRNAITFSGKSAAVSKMMLEYSYAKGEHSFINNPDMGNKEQGDEGFAKISSARVKEEIQFLHDFASKNKITNNIFIRWQENAIMYTAGKEIAFYCFAGKRNESITYPQLMKYLADFPISKTDALHNSAYFEFLKMLSVDFQIITNINPAYKDTLKQNGYNSLAAYLDKTDSYTQGIGKQLMYYYLYKDVSKNRSDNMSRFTSVIEEPYLKGLLLDAEKNGETVFTPFNIFEKMQQQPGGEALSKRLHAIAQQYPDKFIFMDFWGSWCVPCLREMAFYPNLIDKMKEKPIAFLFLAVDTKEEKIIETKNKFGVNAEFISLNDNETRILNNVLSFSSYPSHFIVDPNGMLVNNNIAGIGSDVRLSKTSIDTIESVIGGK